MIRGLVMMIELVPRCAGSGASIATSCSGICSSSDTIDHIYLMQTVAFLGSESRHAGRECDDSTRRRNNALTIVAALAMLRNTSMPLHRPIAVTTAAAGGPTNSPIDAPWQTRPTLVATVPGPGANSGATLNTTAGIMPP